MVVVGVAITVAPVVIDNPSGGLQLYEVEVPLAVRVTLPPEQKAVGLAGEIVITGSGLTVIGFVTVVVQPFPFVTL